MIQVRSEDLFSNTDWFESAKFPRKAANLANRSILLASICFSYYFHVSYSKFCSTL